MLTKTDMFDARATAASEEVYRGLRPLVKDKQTIACGFSGRWGLNRVSWIVSLYGRKQGTGHYF